MKKTEKLVIIGDSAFAEVAFEYFTHDSPYEVVAFSVPKEFKNKDYLFNLPVVNFEDLESLFPYSQYKAFVAITNKNMNRIRTKMYRETKKKGYELVTYISSKAFVWHNVTFKDNCFVFEDNTFQPFVKVGENCIFWAGSHFGHHSVIGNNNFFTSHVVLSGFCEVKDNCFFGVNSTINNNLIIGNDCLVGSGSLIVKSLEDGSFVKGNATFKDPERQTISKDD